MPTHQTVIAERFVERINVHDVDGLLDLMSADHTLVDSLGAATRGAAQLRNGWTTYFRMVPDYTLSIESTLAQGDDVVLLGMARGTFNADGVFRAENAWETPVAIHARVRDARVTLWRIYADNEPIRERIRSSLGGAPVEEMN